MVLHFMNIGTLPQESIVRQTDQFRSFNKFNLHVVINFTFSCVLLRQRSYDATVDAASRINADRGRWLCPGRRQTRRPHSQRKLRQSKLGVDRTGIVIRDGGNCTRSRPPYITNKFILQSYFFSFERLTHMEMTRLSPSCWRNLQIKSNSLYLNVSIRAVPEQSRSIRGWGHWLWRMEPTVTRRVRYRTWLGYGPTNLHRPTDERTDTPSRYRKDWKSIVPLRRFGPLIGRSKHSGDPPIRGCQLKSAHRLRPIQQQQQQQNQSLSNSQTR